MVILQHLRSRPPRRDIARWRRLNWLGRKDCEDGLSQAEAMDYRQPTAKTRRCETAPDPANAGERHHPPCPQDQPWIARLES